MTYHELVEKVREVYTKVDASIIEGHIAYQFNIRGEAEGAFYMEISDGTVKVEPYEYYDRDVIFTTTAESLLKIGTGELDPMWAYTTGRLKVDGDFGKALELKKLSAKAAEALAEVGVEDIELGSSAKTEEAPAAVEVKAEEAPAAEEVKTEEAPATKEVEAEEAPAVEETKAEEVKAEEAPAAEEKKAEEAPAASQKKIRGGKNNKSRRNRKKK